MNRGQSPVCKAAARGWNIPAFLCHLVLRPPKCSAQGQKSLLGWLLFTAHQRQGIFMFIGGFIFPLLLLVSVGAWEGPQPCGLIVSWVSDRRVMLQPWCDPSGSLSIIPSRLGEGGLSWHFGEELRLLFYALYAHCTIGTFPPFKLGSLQLILNPSAVSAFTGL